MENKKKFTPNPDFKLLDQVRETLRYYHYSRSTEKTAPPIFRKWSLMN
jgi:hypothetical protein